MVYVIGYPSHVGGADTELWHTLRLWRDHGIDVTLIPTWHAPLEWEQRLSSIGCNTLVLSPEELKRFNFNGQPVVSFCNGAFLSLAKELSVTGKLVWLNCMTYAFDAEKDFLNSGGRFHKCICQSEFQFRELDSAYRAIGCNDQSFEIIRGAFDTSLMPYSFVKRPAKGSFAFGRLARPDLDKWSSNIWRVYGAVPYADKYAFLMGVNANVTAKIGPTPSYGNVLVPNAMPARVFFNLLHCLVPINGGARENWPRVGLEAMSAGVPIVTQNSWGWREMIQHEETGFLCNNDDELVYFTACLAYNEQLRERIAKNARAYLQDTLVNTSSLITQWNEVFNL